MVAVVRYEKARGEWRGLAELQNVLLVILHRGRSDMCPGTAICTSCRFGSKLWCCRRIAGTVWGMRSSNWSIVGLPWEPIVLSDRLQMRLSPALDNVVIGTFSTLSSRWSSLRKLAVAACISLYVCFHNLIYPCRGVD